MRISATDLEQWRLFQEAEWLTTEMFISQMRGISEPNEAMLRGTAFHSWLELADAGLKRSATVDGYQFVFDLEAELRLPPIRELKTEKTFRIGGMDVTLVAKADVLDGRTVYDHKLTKVIDVEKYLDSMQWRTYLFLFECDRFIYNLFEHSSREVGDLTEVRITDLLRFTCYRYSGLDQDVISSLGKLATFLREYVPERITAGDEKLLRF